MRKKIRTYFKSCCLSNKQVRPPFPGPKCDSQLEEDGSCFSRVLSHFQHLRTLQITSPPILCLDCSQLSKFLKTVSLQFPAKETGSREAASLPGPSLPGVAEEAREPAKPQSTSCRTSVPTRCSYEKGQTYLGPTTGHLLVDMSALPRLRSALVTNAKFCSARGTAVLRVVLPELVGCRCSKVTGSERIKIDLITFSQIPLSLDLLIILQLWSLLPPMSYQSQLLKPRLPPFLPGGPPCSGSPPSAGGGHMGGGAACRASPVCSHSSQTSDRF